MKKKSIEKINYLLDKAINSVLQDTTDKFGLREDPNKEPDYDYMMDPKNDIRFEGFKKKQTKKDHSQSDLNKNNEKKYYNGRNVGYDSTSKGNRNNYQTTKRFNEYQNNKPPNRSRNEEFDFNDNEEDDLEDDDLEDEDLEDEDLEDEDLEDEDLECDDIEDDDLEDDNSEDDYYKDNDSMSDNEWSTDYRPSPNVLRNKPPPSTTFKRYGIENPNSGRKYHRPRKMEYEPEYQHSYTNRSYSNRQAMEEGVRKSRNYHDHPLGLDLDRDMELARRNAAQMSYSKSSFQDRKERSQTAPKFGPSSNTITSTKQDDSYKRDQGQTNKSSRSNETYEHYEYPYERQQSQRQKLSSTDDSHQDSSSPSTREYTNEHRVPEENSRYPKNHTTLYNQSYEFPYEKLLRQQQGLGSPYSNPQNVSYSSTNENLNRDAVPPHKFTAPNTSSAKTHQNYEYPHDNLQRQENELRSHNIEHRNAYPTYEYPQEKLHRQQQEKKSSESNHHNISYSSTNQDQNRDRGSLHNITSPNMSSTNTHKNYEYPNEEYQRQQDDLRSQNNEYHNTYSNSMNQTRGSTQEYSSPNTSSTHSVHNHAQPQKRKEQQDFHNRRYNYEQEKVKQEDEVTEQIHLQPANERAKVEQELTKEDGEESKFVEVNKPNIVTRQMWGALTPMGKIGPAKPPVGTIVFSVNTGTRQCYGPKDCLRTVREIQARHMGQGLADIQYSFLVGGDGYVYEGRGWDKESGLKPKGEEGPNYNIAFVGSFASPSAVPKKMLAPAQDLVLWGNATGKIKRPKIIDEDKVER